MTTLYKYRIYCTTEGKYEYQWSESVPTTCPTNTAHTIDATKITIVDSLDPNEVKIQEEATPTGGHFQIATMKVNALKNATSMATLSWPYPISALSMRYVSSGDANTGHKGDIINVIVGKNTIIGAIGAAVTPASAWTSQNYTSGSVVTNNGRVYTCILDTVSNEEPPNATYWQHGYALTVTTTVTENTAVGFSLNLFDGVNTDDMGRVIKVDTTNSKVYMENNPTNTFSPLSPTYVRQCVHMIKDFEIGEAFEHVIGESKIGASYVPTDVVITLEYTNKSTTYDKEFIGEVEYLY